MYKNGFNSSKPHVKSAKITGAIIGTLWPHGDASAYDTIVRMSQSWVNNICEVDFHGANGSMLGGPEAASSRYTECRLSNASEVGFFSNIKKDVVQMIPNYSEDDEWPLVFPAIFPRLFVNGSQGIGYTISQEWEPGNLYEFVDKVKEYLKKGKVDCSNIYPDYPTGGIIVNKDEIKSIYETGKGKVVLRGKVTIDENLIKIIELPYQVYVEQFIQNIKDLVNKGTLSGVEDILNKSDDNGLLIEIECSDNPSLILNKLYKYTDLQTTFNANQMALVDRVPKMLNLKEYIEVYVNHNIDCIVKEYKYDKAKAEERLEIVEGLIKAIEIIDKVIALIKVSKSSKDAEKNLKDFGFTVNQAKAIVDMRLGKLANLESEDLKVEKSELINIIEKCNIIIESKENQSKEFLSRLVDFSRKYGYKRRTEITNVDIAAEKSEVKVIKEKTVTSYMIILTGSNYIKKVSLGDYKPQGKIKTESDKVISVTKAAGNSSVFLISNTGKLYRLQVSKIPLGKMNSTGLNLNTVFNDTIIKAYNGEDSEPYLVMISDDGLVKKIESKIVFNISKRVGTPIMKLKDAKIIYMGLFYDDSKIKFTYNKKNSR